MIGNFKVFQKAISFIEISIKSFKKFHKVSQNFTKFQFDRNFEIITTEMTLQEISK